MTRPCHLPVKRKDKRLQGRAEVGARRQAPGHSRVTMAVSTQQLAEELQIFGLDYEDSLLEKLAELCVLYRQTEDGMVSELIAFCTSAGKTCLTVDILNFFEYEVLNKKLSKAWHSASKDSGHAGTRDIVSIQELYPFLLKVFGLSTYMCYVISQVVYMLLKQTLKMPNIQSLIYSPVVALLDQCFQN